MEEHGQDTELLVLVKVPNGVHEVFLDLTLKVAQSEILGMLELLLMVLLGSTLLIGSNLHGLLFIFLLIVIVLMEEVKEFPELSDLSLVGLAVFEVLETDAVFPSALRELG